MPQAPAANGASGTTFSVAMHVPGAYLTTGTGSDVVLSDASTVIQMCTRHQNTVGIYYCAQSLYDGPYRSSNQLADWLTAWHGCMADAMAYYFYHQQSTLYASGRRTRQT